MANWFDLKFVFVKIMRRNGSLSFTEILDLFSWKLCDETDRCFPSKFWIYFRENYATKTGHDFGKCWHWISDWIMIEICWWRWANWYDVLLGKFVRMNCEHASSHDGSRRAISIQGVPQVEVRDQMNVLAWTDCLNFILNSFENFVCEDEFWVKLIYRCFRGRLGLALNWMRTASTMFESPSEFRW